MQKIFLYYYEYNLLDFKVLDKVQEFNKDKNDVNVSIYYVKTNQFIIMRGNGGHFLPINKCFNKNLNSTREYFIMCLMFSNNPC